MRFLSSPASFCASATCSAVVIGRSNSFSKDIPASPAETPQFLYSLSGVELLIGRHPRVFVESLVVSVVLFFECVHRSDGLAKY